MHKGLIEPTCDAQMAKGNPWKLITSGFYVHSVNYALFSAMYIKILSSDTEMTTKWKNWKTPNAHEENTDLIS